jgi:hypothetical protein
MIISCIVLLLVVLPTALAAAVDDNDVLTP